jgi:hypothetical protein
MLPAPPSRFMLLCSLCLVLGLISPVTPVSAQSDAFVSPSPSFSQRSGRVIYSSSEGKFSIILPPAFPVFEKKEEEVSVKPQVNEVAGPLTKFLSVTEHGVCAVFYNDFNPDVFGVLDSASLLDAGESGVTGTTDVNTTSSTPSEQATPTTPLVKVYQQENFNVNGYPARTVRFSEQDTDNTTYTRLDFILVKPRLYQVYYSSYDANALDDPNIQNYFRSFKLMD